jgi:transcriptional regulator with XRE-family HTH domain
MGQVRKSTTSVTAAQSPVVRRRELGALLRELRTQAGLTVEEVADELMCSASKVSRMETGHRGVSPRDIRDLCGLYGVVDPSQRERLSALAKGGKEPGWWQPYDLPARFATYVGLEAEATCISNYEPGVVPGLVETADYARAVHERTIDRPSDETIEQMIEVRRGRQTILTREDPPPPCFQAVVDEGALHRVVGSPAIMSAALERVIQACELPNVSIRVLSYEAGAHPALDSTFVLLQFRDPLPAMVYVEGLLGQMWLEKPQEAERYKQVFEFLQKMSMSQSASIKLLAKLAAVYKRF